VVVSAGRWIFKLSEPTTLRARAFGAGRWILVSLGVSQIVRLANSLIMSRLLSPDAFGLMAIASATQIMITLLSDIGLHQAIVQSPRGADRNFLRTAWTLQILRGGFIWLACSLAAICLMVANSLGWVASNSVYADPRLPWVTIATASTAVILGFQSMKSITQNRRLELKHITIIEIVASLIGLCLASAIGLLTGSVWAFVTGVITSALVTTMSSHVWLSGDSDHFGWEAAAISELRRFGKWALLSSASMAFAMNGDRFLLGLWLSPAQLGNYSIAANLATLTEALGNRVFTTLSFPAMSEAVRSDHWRFVSVYFRMKWLADASFVGMAGLLFAAGPSIVSIMYDPRYALAGTMLQYLSFALIFVRYNLTGNAYLAMGRQNYLALLNYTQLASLFILVPTLYYAFGIIGAIIGIALYRAPILLIIFFINGKHHLNNMKLELAAFGFWLLGYMFGLAAKYPVDILHQYWRTLHAGSQ
jgi:O-antigen/teichoic acid export membrane protein